MNDLILTAGEGFNSTIIQCVHEQSLTGMCIFHVLFAFNGLPMYKSLTKTKKPRAHKTLKREALANAILKHYISSSLITVKRHAMVLSFFKS